MGLKLHESYSNQQLLVKETVKSSLILQNCEKRASAFDTGLCNFKAAECIVQKVNPLGAFLKFRIVFFLHVDLLFTVPPRS